MPTFIKVGRLDQNLSGITSKGYFISRSGKSVTFKWGKVTNKKGKFYWAGRNLPVSKTVKFKTTEEAIWLYNDRTRRRRKEGYDHMGSHVRIYAFSKLK